MSTGGEKNNISDTFEQTKSDLAEIRARLARNRERALALNSQAQETAVQSQKESDVREAKREHFLKSKDKGPETPKKPERSA